MINQRRTVLLLAVAVAVIAVAMLLASQRNRGQDTLAGQTVLPGLREALNDVTELRISRGDGTHVTVRKGESDWVVAEREFPADPGKVRKLLLDLASLSVVEEKTSDPGSYARIGVEDVTSATSSGTRIEAVTPKKTFGLIAGDPSGTKNGYVREPGAKTSYLATPQIRTEADPKRWLDRTLVDIPQDRVKEIALKPAKGRAYTVSREKKEQTDFTVSDIPKGMELTSPSAPNSLASELMSLTLDDVRKAPEEAAKPEASTTFRTFDGLELQFDGSKDGDRHYITVTARSTAKESEAEAQKLDARLKGWQFEIPGYKYDLLFRPQEELLVKSEPQSKNKSKPET